MEAARDLLGWSCGQQTQANSLRHFDNRRPLARVGKDADLSELHIQEQWFPVFPCKSIKLNYKNFADCRFRCESRFVDMVQPILNYPRALEPQYIVSILQVQVKAKKRDMNVFILDASPLLGSAKSALPSMLKVLTSTISWRTRETAKCSSWLLCP